MFAFNEMGFIERGGFLVAPRLRGRATWCRQRCNLDSSLPRRRAYLGRGLPSCPQERFFALQRSQLAIWAYGRKTPDGHPQAPLDPRLHRPEPPASLRKRLAVSSFRRRRRLRRWRSSPISRSPLRPNQRLPEPSRPTHPNSATPGRLRPSAASAGGATTTENGREAAERDRKSAAASGGSPQAPAGTLHTQI